MGLYDAARSVFPQWINSLARRHWGLYFDTIALTIDALDELVDIGMTAARPGQVDEEIAPNLGGYTSVDALKLIGEDRMVARGLAESTPDYALRLRRYRDDWRLSGTPLLGVLKAVRGALSAPGQVDPLLRLVTARGTWHTLEVDGTLRVQTPDGTGFYLTPTGECGADSTLAHTWDWDSTTDPAPEDQGDDARFWVLVYLPAAGPYLTTDGGLPGSVVVDAGWNDRMAGAYNGSPWAATAGTNAPISLLENVRGAVQSRRTAGYRCAYIIAVFDSDAFNPDGSSTGPDAYPDGTWGHHTRFNATSGEQEIARYTGAEYCPAEPGGATLE